MADRQRIATVPNPVDSDANHLLSIGDVERRSGLYILGKPRMGKSWLMVNLALSDIKNGHGVFFLDPHGEAINDIVEKNCPQICKRGIIIDPEMENSLFGINPLYCPDIINPKLRSDTFARAKGLFDKLWRNTFEERPWLQLILQNTLYAFIENQGFTLAELPMFFRDPSFRAYICNNIRFNEAVREYWLNTFASKSKRDQDTQLEAAQTRSEIMLAHPYVSEIVGQSRNVLDFQRFINYGNILLVKLSTNLPYESKKIIGTLLVSELLYAIQNRPEANRKQFCIFIDEFQTFAAYQDFSTLITQAPKYGVATTLVHHERLGQLAGNREIMGATAAIANKVIFQVTGADAQDLAPEFAEEPPTETKSEEVLSISQNPVRDLLNGHGNADIRALVNRSIRPIKDRLESIQGEIEGRKVRRMEHYDEAALSRIYERVETERERYGFNRSDKDPLAGTVAAGRKAREETRKLEILTMESELLQLVLRRINELLVGVMEGDIHADSDLYLKYIATLGDGLVLGGTNCQAVIEVYLLLLFGDQKETRFLPDWFVAQENLFASGLLRITSRDFVDPPSREGFLSIIFSFYYEKNEVINGIRRAVDELNPVLLRTLEGICKLSICLADPKNHIKIRTGQQTITEKPSRTVADMTGEMAGILTALSKYTAYAKVLQGNRMWKGQMQTHKLPERQPADELSKKIVWMSGFTWHTPKRAIENEIRKRQQVWRPQSEAKPAQTLAHKPKAGDRPPSPHEPPPTRY